MAKLQCAKCGTEISEENLTCPSCGYVNDLEIVNKLMAQEREQVEKEQIQKEALKKEQDINKRRQLYDYAKKIRRLFKIPYYVFGVIALVIVVMAISQGIGVWFSTTFRTLSIISLWMELSLVNRLNKMFAPAKIVQKAKELNATDVLDGVKLLEEKDCDIDDYDALNVANEILINKKSKIQQLNYIFLPIKIIVELIGYYFLVDALFYVFGILAVFDYFPILNVKTYIAVGVWIAILILDIIFFKIELKEYAKLRKKEKN